MIEGEEVFSFELQETLFFDRGQEVHEMIGIALDPKISIQTHDDYITIKGIIVLEGEYEKAEETMSREESVEVASVESKRYLDNIEDAGDGFAHFSHRFPIEISIPTYRVVDIEKVAVYVDSFDYELEANDELQIDSLIHIYGIQAYEESSGEQAIEEEVDKGLESNPEDMLEHSIEFEVQEAMLEESRNETEELARKEDSEVEDEVQKPEEEKLFEDLLPEESEQVEEQDLQTNIVERKDESEQTTIEHEEEPVKEQTDVREESTEESAEETSEEDEEEETEESNFLSTFFSTRGAEDEENEAVAKSTQLRICIVQADDTLEKIAERYEVSKGRLLKQNQLENDEINEGQLLSIPPKSNS